MTYIMCMALINDDFMTNVMFIKGNHPYVIFL